MPPAVYTHRTFRVQPNGSGQLQLQFQDNGGTNTNWVLNAVTVRATSTVAALNVTGPGLSGPAADGATVDVFAVSNATVGALYTVAASSGAVVQVDGSPTADADARYEGFQVVALGASFTVGLQRPMVAGTATVTVAEVSGAGRGSASQAYTAGTAWQFDFNRDAASPTASGYTGVLPTTVHHCRKRWNPYTYSNMKIYIIR